MGSDTYTVNHWNEATHAHEPSILTLEQDFTFDALGFVVLPQLLSQAELSACRDGGDGLGDLCGEAGAVGRYVRELCGDGFLQDGPARHVPARPPQEGTTNPLCRWKAGRTRWTRAYINLAGWSGRNADGTMLQAGRRRLGRGSHPAVPGAGGSHRPHGLRRRQVPAGGRALLAQERAARSTNSILQPPRRAPGAGGGATCCCAPPARCTGSAQRVRGASCSW